MIFPLLSSRVCLESHIRPERIGFHQGDDYQKDYQYKDTPESGSLSEWNGKGK